MILNHIRNRKIRKKYSKDNVGYDSEGSLIEDTLLDSLHHFSKKK